MNKVIYILILMIIYSCTNININIEGEVPTLTTKAISNIGNTSAMSGGVILNDGGVNIISKGVCWSTSPNPSIENDKTVDGIGTSNYSSSLNGLTRNTTYYVRAYAINTAGIGYGNELTFKTKDSTIVDPSTSPPTVVFDKILNLRETYVYAYGNVTNAGGSSVTERGFQVSMLSNFIGSTDYILPGSTGTFSKTIDKLVANTTYYIRAYAVNSFGKSFSNSISFTTLPLPLTVKDIDGNVYNTVTIGTQTWMVENLKVTKYRNGVSLPKVTDNTQWANLTTGAYCVYNDVSVNSTIYGNLYNWYAATNINNIAPVGWHVPSDEEFKTLMNYLGGSLIAGAALKDVNGFKLNMGATNSSGFSGLGSGLRWDNSGAFYGIQETGCFWSTSNTTFPEKARGYCLMNSNTYFSLSNENRARGMSIRCIKD